MRAWMKVKMMSLAGIKAYRAPYAFRASALQLALRMRVQPNQHYNSEKLLKNV